MSCSSSVRIALGALLAAALAACGGDASPQPGGTADGGPSDGPASGSPDRSGDALPFGDGSVRDGPAAGDGPAAAPPQSVVLIGWDGVQRAHFRQCFNKTLAACPNGVPNFAALFGTLRTLTVTSAATCTKPGWVELLTGYDATSLGIPDNAVFKPVPAGYSAQEKVEALLGPANIVTLFLAGKTGHVGGACNTTPKEPWCVVKKNLDYFENGLGDNANVGNKALALLEQHRGKRIFAFFHFENPDHTGHANGESSPEYTAQILDDDMWLGKIVDKLKALGMYDGTLIYVVSDHGFDEGLKSHANAPYMIFGTNDPAVVRNGDRKDVAPTILARFGASLGAAGAAPAVHGKPLTATPTACVAEGQAFVEYAGAPTCCAGLQVINLDKRAADGKCIVATGAKDGSGYCTKCGDGQCVAPEHKCNCAADCR